MMKLRVPVSLYSEKLCYRPGNQLLVGFCVSVEPLG